MYHLLLIEDDKELGAVIERELDRQQYQVWWAQSLEKARQIYSRHRIDLAIVDLYLPDGQGFDFLEDCSCPVLMMSALSDPANRLKGVELGAVDFMPKPFMMKELLIKIKRCLPLATDVIKIGDRVLDMVNRQVVSKGQTLFLNRRDFKLLEILIQQAPRVVSRDEIIDHVYGEDQNPSHRTIDNAIVGLRQLLNDKDHQVIRSVRGEGYQWSYEGKNNG